MIKIFGQCKTLASPPEMKWKSGLLLQLYISTLNSYHENQNIDQSTNAHKTIFFSGCTFKHPFYNYTGNFYLFMPPIIRYAWIATVLFQSVHQPSWERKSDLKQWIPPKKTLVRIDYCPPPGFWTSSRRMDCICAKYAPTLAWRRTRWQKQGGVREART